MTIKKILLCFVAFSILGIQTSTAQVFQIVTGIVAAIPNLYQSTTRGQISPASHYVYPNSNVTPLGSTNSEIKKFSVVFPPKLRAKDLDELYGQAMSKHQGSDLIIDTKVDTKFTTIFIFQTMKVTLSGTAAHMEVGQQYIGQKDYVVNNTPPVTNNNSLVVSNSGQNDSTSTGQVQPQPTGQQQQVTNTATAQRSTYVPAAAPEVIIPEKPKTPSFWIAVHAGLFQPMGKFKRADLKKPLNEAVGATPGFYVSTDLTEYFKSSYGNPVRFGMTQSVGYASTTVNWTRTYQGAETFSILDLKAGVILTAKVGSSMAGDFYFRAGAINYEGESTFGTTFGANFRLKLLIASLSVNTGKVNAGSGLDVILTSSPYKVPVTAVKLGLGIKLGKA